MIKVNKKCIGVGIIFAADSNNGIGRDGKLPWHFPEDLQEFKKATLGTPIVMGRKTWDSLGQKALPGRINIVVSSKEHKSEGIIFATGLHSAIHAAVKTGADFVWVIGGSSLIEAAMDYADIVQITHVLDEYETDVRIPNHVTDNVIDYALEYDTLVENSDFIINRYVLTSTGKDYVKLLVDK